MHLGTVAGMKTIIAQDKRFTMDNLAEVADTHLLDEGRRPNLERLRELIRGAVEMVLPGGLTWNEDQGTVGFQGAPGEGPAVTLDLEGIAYVVIGAVTSEPWARPRGVPPGIGGIVFGWGLD